MEGAFSKPYKTKRRGAVIVSLRSKGLLNPINVEFQSTVDFGGTPNPLEWNNILAEKIPQFDGAYMEYNPHYMGAKSLNDRQTVVIELEPHMHHLRAIYAPLSIGNLSITFMRVTWLTKIKNYLSLKINSVIH